MLREQKISLFFLMDGFINMLYSHCAVLVQNHCTAQHGADSPRLSHTLEKQKYISTVLLLSPIQRHNTLNRTLLMWFLLAKSMLHCTNLQQVDVHMAYTYAENAYVTALYHLVIAPKRGEGSSNSISWVLLCEYIHNMMESHRQSIWVYTALLNCP